MYLCNAHAGFYLGALESKAGKVVWEQRPSANTGTDDSSGTGDAAGTRHPGDIEAGDGDAAAAGAAGQAVALRKRWCDYHSWRLVGGLDGSKDTFSLELVGAPGGCTYIQTHKYIHTHMSHIP